MRDLDTTPTDLVFQFSATDCTVVATSPAARRFLGEIAGTAAGLDPTSITVTLEGTDRIWERAHLSDLTYSSLSAYR